MTYLTTYNSRNFGQVPANHFVDGLLKKHFKRLLLLQLWHYYPQLEPLYTEFEKDYDPNPIIDLMKENNYIIPIGCVVVYLLFCYYGKAIMKDIKPFGLVNTLAGWNLFLSTFSFWGATRTVPHLLHRLTIVTFEDAICEAPMTAYGSGACGFAVQCFILSKILALVDTIFIVLRKKPLTFLHWYHNVIVLLYCWNACVTESAAGIWFVAMNYTP